MNIKELPLMSIINFGGNAQPQATNRSPFAGLTSIGGNTDRPKAKVWLNVGYEKNGKFINLPIGLPIDTMDAADVRGQNEDWVKQRTAQNDLLKALQQLGGTMAPSEEREIQLTVKLRRVGEQLEIAKDQNEYATDFTSLFAKPQPIAAE